jgi:hypothetical protein
MQLNACGWLIRCELVDAKIRAARRTHPVTEPLASGQRTGIGPRSAPTGQLFIGALRLLLARPQVVTNVQIGGRQYGSMDLQLSYCRAIL